MKLQNTMQLLFILWSLCLFVIFTIYSEAQLIHAATSNELNYTINDHPNYEEVIKNEERISNPATQTMNPTIESKSNSQPLLALATTVVDSDDPEKQLIQTNTLRCLASLKSDVYTVVFTESKRYKSEFGDVLHFQNQIKTNKYGTPIFKEMIIYLENTVNASFYGYCNGDLLFESTLPTLLQTINQLIHNHTLHSKTFLVGRRTNIFAPFPLITTNAEANDDQILSSCYHHDLFQTDAEDYFIFTRNTFDWSSIKSVVIGRPGYDNYLVTQVHHHTKSISFVDITNALVVSHQTDSNGIRAGHRKRKDKMYNMRLIKSDWQKGRTEYSDWILEQFPRKSYILHQRYYKPDIAFDDNYLTEEVELIKRWIKPTDVCVEFAWRAVQGVLSPYCKRYIVIIFDNTYIEAMQSNPKIEVIYGKALYTEPGYGQYVISHMLNFLPYINALKSKHIPVDIIILNGRCKPQVAYEMRQVLKYNGLLLVRGNKPHYKIIDSMYNYIQKYMYLSYPGKEFDTLTVYQNNVRETRESFPSWW